MEKKPSFSVNVMRRVLLQAIQAGLQAPPSAGVAASAQESGPRARHIAQAVLPFTTPNVKLYSETTPRRTLSAANAARRSAIARTMGGS